jgi:hypothetical protein
LTACECRLQVRLQGRLGHPVVLEEEVVVGPPVVVDHLQVDLPVDARNLRAFEIPQVDAFELLVTLVRARLLPVQLMRCLRTTPVWTGIFQSLALLVMYQ